jgi:uncharacterized protein DUF6332
MDDQQRAAATGRRGPRQQAERDAVTVEIVFALFSAALLAAAVFFVLAGPALFGDGSDDWIREGQWWGSAAFVGRVLWVLVRRRRQPSQPGRTSPYS